MTLSVLSPGLEVEITPPRQMYFEISLSHPFLLAVVSFGRASASAHQHPSGFLFAAANTRFNKCKDVSLRILTRDSTASGGDTPSQCSRAIGMKNVSPVTRVNTPRERSRELLTGTRVSRNAQCVGMH